MQSQWGPRVWGSQRTRYFDIICVHSSVLPSETVSEEGELCDYLGDTWVSVNGKSFSRKTLKNEIHVSLLKEAANECGCDSV
jgi:hypothetical protein